VGSIAIENITFFSFTPAQNSKNIEKLVIVHSREELICFLHAISHKHR